MNKLILLRHGESIWNKENRFTGWTDVPLSEKGRDEARRAGELLRSFSIYPDISFISLLKRAIVTRFLVMEELDRLWTPAYKDWRLNERHYGALQGLNKLETSEKYGAEQVHIWRRSYDVRPPQVGDEDPRYPAHDARYQMVQEKLLPHGESLEDTVHRVLPCWKERILPEVEKGKTILVAAHGNSLRALIMMLQNLSPRQIVDVEIPTGKPLILVLGENLTVLNQYYLG